ncbi:MAG: NAD-dependent epimerase/dehydratase family protein [Planctomycetota bacterium]
MSKVLITGAAGFLGRYLVHEFSRLGWEITALDQVSIDAASHNATLAGVNWLQMTLPADALCPLLKTLRPDVLVHAAGPASVPGSVANPLADFEGSVRVLCHILDILRRVSPQTRLIFLSSAAVYGNPEHLPVREDAPCRPISPYGFHKLMCERLLDEYATVYGLRVCAARIFSAYGPGLRRQALWDICRKILTRPTVELSGTGAETRDFIHGADIATALVHLAERAQFKAETYNLASGVETTIAALAQQLVAELNFGNEVVFSGIQRAGDPLRWVADITRLRELGFIPKVSLTEGLAQYARWVATQQVN